MAVNSYDYSIVSNVNIARSQLIARLQVAAMLISMQAETYAKEKITDVVYGRPESWYVRTGLLRNSITSTVRQEDGCVCAVIGTNVEYAPYVELGTGIYAQGESHAKHIPWTFKGSDGKFHTTSGVIARPFLRPAIEDHVKEYKEIVESLLRNGL